MVLPSPLSHEFPLHTSVENWESILKTFYLSQHSKGLPQSKIMKSFKIIKIRRYKEKRNLEHEYLIAEVSTTMPGEPCHPQIERLAEVPLPAKTKKGPLCTLSTLSSQVSLALSKKLPVNDHVYSVLGWCGFDSCIGYLDCRNAQINMLDLAVAAEVHAHSTMYQLFKCQCFWYSDMIVAILEQEFPLIQLVESSDVVKLARAKDAVIDVLDEVSGTCKKLPIYSRRISIVKEIHDIYQIRKREAYDLIKRAQSAAEQPTLKMENADKREVEDANKRAKEADRKVEKARGDADKAREDADKAGEDADKAREDADKAREDADKAREDADKAREDADKAREDANKAREDADKAREDADKAREDADQAREDADKAREDADKAREDTDKAREDADKKAEEAQKEKEALM